MRISCWPRAMTRLKNLSRCRARPRQSPPTSLATQPGFPLLAAAPAGLPLPAEFPQGRIVLTVGRWAASEQYEGAEELIRRSRATSRLRRGFTHGGCWRGR